MLLYDSKSGVERQEKWFDMVSNAAFRLETELLEGKYVSVEKQFADCLGIAEKDGEKAVYIDYERVQKAGDQQGYFTLASSLPLSAGKANRFYQLCSGPEEQFSVVKRQIESGSAEMNDAGETAAKLTAALIAAVIWNEMARIARECRIPTDELPDELNEILMYLNDRDEYVVRTVASQRQTDFMMQCGICPADLDRIAAAENRRIAGAEPDLRHCIRQPGEAAEAPRRKPGRPKGSKNIKTLEKEAQANSKV